LEAMLTCEESSTIDRLVVCLMWRISHDWLSKDGGLATAVTHMGDNHTGVITEALLWKAPP